MKLVSLGEFSLQDQLDRHWLRTMLVIWACVAAWFLWDRWGNITWLALSDTDDNMRLMQVRAWMHGQGWYDLRNYRLDPALGGFDIHWSRIPDLPIAGLILFFQPFVGPVWAERLACGIAPLIPLAVAMAGVSVTIRRLVHPLAWPVGLIVLAGCTSTMLMFAPLRIDHHNWQLACLAWTVAGLADSRRVRGGVTVGISSTVSLAIGLELLPYCAMAGAIVALRWVWDREEAQRLATYGLTLGGGSALGFALFASHANTAMRCDALTPVWLSVTVVAGALLLALARISAPARWQRLVLGGIAGGVIAAGFALLFPHCLGRPEGVSPELQRVWLDNVREARPIFRQPIQAAFPMVVLPAVGLLGAIFATVRAWGKPQAVAWAAIVLFTAFAGAMLLWQVRAAPAAQLLSVAGATALAVAMVPWFLNQPYLLVRVFGSLAAFLVVSGLFAGFIIPYLPREKGNPRAGAINQANASCTRVTTLSTLNRLPPAIMFTQVDLGPRLITITHHSAVGGPYHRNERAILDIHHGFTGETAAFPAIAAAHRAQFVLLCPDMSETTVYRARNPDGFYAQLARGRVPAWLQPVRLPEGSPFRLFRIRYDMVMPPPQRKQAAE